MRQGRLRGIGTYIACSQRYPTRRSLSRALSKHTHAASHWLLPHNRRLSSSICRHRARLQLRTHVQQQYKRARMQPHIDARIETVDVDLETALQNSKAVAGNAAGATKTGGVRKRITKDTSSLLFIVARASGQP